MEKDRQSARARRAPAVALALMLVTASLLTACARQSSTESGGGTATAPSAAPNYAGAPTVDGGALSGTPKGGLDAAAPDQPATPGQAGVQKLIVVNKTMRVETADVDASITKIRALTATAKGDITSLQVATSLDEPVFPVPVEGDKSQGGSSVPLRAFVVVRVPSAGYGTFIAEIAKLGRVLYQSESADDVTQQHVDMTARLGNLQAEQSRLRQLFARAKTVRDMLSIEKELTRVQGDIESMQAQISYLEKQAAMATVTIELTEPSPIVAPSGTDWGVATALKDSIRAFVSTLNGLIVILGPVLALLLFIGVPAYFVVRAIRKRLRAKKPTDS